MQEPNDKTTLKVQTPYLQILTKQNHLQPHSVFCKHKTLFCHPLYLEPYIVLNDRPPGDRDKWQPPLKVYQRRKGVGSKAQALIGHSLDDNGLSWDLIQVNMGSA